METFRNANEPWTPEQLAPADGGDAADTVPGDAALWHLYRMFLRPLTVFDRETVGRVSFLEGRLRPHFILTGEREWVPPEVGEAVHRGQAHFYFHTHPRGPLSNCWPSVEDLVDAAMTLWSLPRLRAEIIATSCGLVVIARSAPAFDEWSRRRAPMQWQLSLYRHFTDDPARRWTRDDVTAEARRFGLDVRFILYHRRGATDNFGTAIQYDANAEWLGGLLRAIRENE